MNPPEQFEKQRPQEHSNLTEQSDTLDDARTRWRAALSEIARRLRWRRAAQAWGAAAVALIAVVCVVAAWMDAARYDVLSVQAGREIVVLCVVAASVLLLWSVLRGASPRWLTDQLEHGDRALDGLMVSAMELYDGQDRAQQAAGAAHNSSRALAALVFIRAEAQLRNGQGWLAAERRRRRQAGFMALTPVAVVALLTLAAPEWLSRGVTLIAKGTPAIAAHNPYSLEVSPGDVEVPEGSDALVTAQPIGFTADPMTLRVRHTDDEAWRTVAMETSKGGAEAVALLTSLARDLQYRVVTEDVVSAVHRITVIPRPTVQAISLEYHYPEHTGAVPLTVPNGGDIQAIAGTKVIVRVQADAAVAAGQLRLAAGASIPLEAVEGAWQGEFTLRSDDTYRVELASVRGGGLQAASREYAITALPDGLPRVAITAPGQDAKVSPIEEVAIQVEANDDVAVRELQLRVSVNGASEQTVRLPGGAAPGRSGVHTLALEELELSPGDLIAFHAVAKDSNYDERRVQTDIYFLEVRPFERFYRRAQAGGGRGGGDNGPLLAAQQRALVVALFKLVRDGAAMAEEQFTDTMQTLGQAQARIRDRVEAIARRIAQRSVMDAEPGYKTMAEELPPAIAAMVEVEGFLGAADAAMALPKARIALLHLQRADAAFRDVRIAQAQRGSNGRSSADDLANLFKLEMDRLRSQYASVDRGQSGGREQDIDEVMRKLEELAERQRQGTERGADLGSTSAQQALEEAVAALLRELERLTRKKPDPSLEHAKRELREAANAMGSDTARRGANNGQASVDNNQANQDQTTGGATHGNASNGPSSNIQQAGSARGGNGVDRRRQQERLLASLEAARRALVQRGPARLSETVNKAHQLAKALNVDQAVAQQQLDALKRKEQQANDKEPLLEQKARMLRDAEQLTEAVAVAAREARRLKSKPIAQGLQDVARGIREGALAPALKRSGEKIAASELDSELERVEQQIARVAAATEQRLAKAAAQARITADGIADDARRRLAQATRRLAGLAERMDVDGEGTTSARSDGGGGGSSRPRTAGGFTGQDDINGVRGGTVSRQGGGSYGGLRGRIHGNADFTEVLRDGLRLSAAALREVDTVVPPTARGGQDIGALVAELEALASAETSAVDRIGAVVRGLQRVEQALRDGDTRQPAIAAIPQPVAPKGYRRLVEAYYRQLGEAQ